MPPKKTNSKTVPVEAIRHKDKRKNIPTGELRRFVKKAEEDYPVTLYPRNPDLDPQLVWKGKDQQDAKSLEVPAVPVYIQEKIHPRAIVENIKKQAKKALNQIELDLFSDFNGLPDFEAKIDFYHHESNWTNRMILGDSLLVMNSLAEKEGLKGQVQCIYMDPPYGIKFNSNWQVSTQSRQVADGKQQGITAEPDQIRAFRDTWKHGISSYLAYLKDRLVAARSLLTETGSIFLQIGEENLHIVRCMADEVFGPANFCRQISYVTTSFQADNILGNTLNYILWYAKDKDQIRNNKLFKPKRLGDDGAAEYRWLMLRDGSIRDLTEEEQYGLKEIPKGSRPWRFGPVTSQGYSEEGSKDYKFKGKSYSPGPNQHWKSNPEGVERAGRLIARENSLAYYLFLDDFPVSPITNQWTDTKWGYDAGDKRYVVQTNTKIVERCLLLATQPGDLVLDPTCGSGTTAFVAEQWGRRWITIDTSRVALAIARTRMMSAKYPYYLLADSPEGLNKEADLTGKTPPSYSTQNDIKRGFVYQRVPHVTLGAIANNPDIKSEMDQGEKERFIAKNADQEYLQDQPYDDPKKVRVCGPFTVESLSPHRILGTDEASLSKNADSAIASTLEATDFNAQILENLRKAGIQNTKKYERLEFTSLDPHAGTWIHALGRQEVKGSEKIVALSIGPKYGTITPEHIREASKEAGRIKIRGQEVDLVVILGFAFGPHVYEEVKQHGDMTILIVRMNPDLMMANELLKKTASANLFMVFGEPDVEIKQLKSGQYQVSIRGVDIYDPTTGEIRSSSKDDIACWFIDTDYDEESFFVRHAYFLGNNEPYDKLKRALRAEVDEAAWSSLYSDTSRPFDAPETGKIAVKVINHYGDEVMRVFEVKNEK
jgi:adenine-specific DNA-methyltransferase